MVGRATLGNKRAGASARPGPGVPLDFASAGQASGLTLAWTFRFFRPEGPHSVSPGRGQPRARVYRQRTSSWPCRGHSITSTRRRCPGNMEALYWYTTVVGANGMAPTGPRLGVLPGIPGPWPGLIECGPSGLKKRKVQTIVRPLVIARDAKLRRSARPRGRADRGVSARGD